MHIVEQKFMDQRRFGVEPGFLFFNRKAGVLQLSEWIWVSIHLWGILQAFKI